MDIKVGYLASYDYEMIKQSLPTVYDVADQITIALDKDRKTFMGETFLFDDSFYEWIRSFDHQHKIRIYEDGFYVPGFSTREAEIRERNMLARQMGKGGWHLQVDVDEYFVDFKSVVDELRSLEKKVKKNKMTYRVYWCTIFKIVSGGYFLIEGNPENFALATNNPVYEDMRYNHSNKNEILNHVVLHQSWARSEEALSKKLRNWSHNADFDTQSYFNFWKSIDVHNYKFIKDFHPLYPDCWTRLLYVKADSIEDLLKKIPSKLSIDTRIKKSIARQWMPPVIYNRMAKLKSRLMPRQLAGI